MQQVTPRTEVPGEAVDAERVAGHWLLARLGKTVLRPGGVEVTTRVLSGLAIAPDDDVVEVAPGLGATTRLVLDAGPASYTGVDRDPAAAARVGDLLAGPDRRVINASAADTGLPDASADVVFGEAYLTMLPDSVKRRTVAEAARVLRPGGRFALHEVAFAPDDIDDEARARVTADLTSTIKVGVSPLTASGWDDLLDQAGLEVQDRFHAPLHLLEPRRLIADEGVVGAARFAANVARDSAARRRVTAMRSAMRRHSRHLQAYGLVAVRRASDA